MHDLSPSGLALPAPGRRTLLRGIGGAALLGAGIPLLECLRRQRRGRRSEDGQSRVELL